MSPALPGVLNCNTCISFFLAPSFNLCLKILLFPESTVPEIGRMAWGYIEYDKPLENKDIDGYELMPAAFFS